MYHPVCPYCHPYVDNIVGDNKDDLYLWHHHHQLYQQPMCINNDDSSDKPITNTDDDNKPLWQPLTLILIMTRITTTINLTTGYDNDLMEMVQ